MFETTAALESSRPLMALVSTICASDRSEKKVEMLTWVIHAWLTPLLPHLEQSNRQTVQTGPPSMNLGGGGDLDGGTRLWEITGLTLDN